MRTTITLFLVNLLVITQTALMAEEEAAPPKDQGLWQTLIMIGIALAFFYLILLRPEQKRRKALEDMRSSLKQGDKVTAMGIVGNVLRVQEETVILKMYDGSKIEVLKGAVTEMLAEDEEKEKPEAKEGGEP